MHDHGANQEQLVPHKSSNYTQSFRTITATKILFKIRVENKATISRTQSNKIKRQLGAGEGLSTLRRNQSEFAGGVGAKRNRVSRLFSRGLQNPASTGSEIPPSELLCILMARARCQVSSHARALSASLFCPSTEIPPRAQRPRNHCLYAFSR